MVCFFEKESTATVLDTRIVSMPNCNKKEIEKVLRNVLEWNVRTLRCDNTVDLFFLTSNSEICNRIGYWRLKNIELTKNLFHIAIICQDAS